MSEQVQQENTVGTPTKGTPQTAKGGGGTKVSHPAAQKVEGMLASGQAAPAEIGALLLANPAARAEIIELLHKALGNTFVGMILDLASDFAGEDGGAEKEHLGPVRIVARRLRVRTTPTTKTDENIIGSLPKGTVVTALAKEDSWLRIEYEGKKAYIHSGYAAPVDSPVTEKKPKAAVAHAEDEEAHETAPPVPASKTPPSDPWAHAANNHAHEAPTQAPTQAPTHAPTPAPVQAPTPAPTQAPQQAKPDVTPVQMPAQQAPKPTPAPTPAPTQAPTPAPVTAQTNAQPANAVHGGAFFEKVYQAGTKGHFQQAQVFVSPGGITDTPDIFIFLHGYDANLGIDKKLKGKGGVLSGIDVAKDAMEKAQGKNTVAIIPQGVLGRNADYQNEGGHMTALEKGLPSFITSVLTPLAADLGMAELKPGHIGLAGHSAGGYQGIHQALSGAGALADNITDITLMDSAYAAVHFKDTEKWMYAGSPGKTVRIIGTKLQTRDKGKTKNWAPTFGKDKLAEHATAHGMTVQDVGGEGEHRGELMTVAQHSRVMTAKGEVQCDVLILEYIKTGNAVKDHHPLRDEVMDDAIFNVGDGAKSNDDFGKLDHGGKLTAAVTGDKKDEHHDDVTLTKPPTKAAPVKDDHHDVAVEAKPKVEPPKPKKPEKKHDDHHDDDQPFVPSKMDGKVDAFGNSIERRTDRTKAKVGEQTFKNPFTVVAKKATLYNHKGKELKEKLPSGTQVFVGDMKGARVQITSADYSVDDDIWLDFVSLGGKGSDVGLGNEKVDPEDKARADKIRAGLPKTNPGTSQHTWGFSGKFQPSLGGVALSGSLMSKVHALMEWAIQNDMVLGDIKIGSGMRDPKSAHYMCVRYEMANMKRLNHVTMANLKALPGGRDEDGNLWYKEGWSDEDAIKYAQDKIKAEGAKGKPAAAGYNPGDSRRLPLPLNGKPGVSRHCSGHAVDVDIPWRSESDPNKKDVWAWEHIYHQFGLMRPLHRTISNPKDEESWHIEETGKALAVEGEHKDDED